MTLQVGRSLVMSAKLRVGLCCLTYGLTIRDEWIIASGRQFLRLVFVRVRFRSIEVVIRTLGSVLDRHRSVVARSTVVVCKARFGISASYYQATIDVPRMRARRMARATKSESALLSLGRCSRCTSCETSEPPPRKTQSVVSIRIFSILSTTQHHTGMRCRKRSGHVPVPLPAHVCPVLSPTSLQMRTKSRAQRPFRASRQAPCSR